jgi:hypothetical protein
MKTLSLTRFLIVRAAPLLVLSAVVLAVSTLIGARTTTTVVTTVTLNTALQSGTGRILLIDSARPGMDIGIDIPPGNAVPLAGGHNILLTPAGAIASSIRYSLFYIPARTRFDMPAEALPFTSPDGTIAVFNIGEGTASERYRPGLYRLELASGRVTQLANHPTENTRAWGPDNRLVFAAAGVIYLTGPDARDPRPVPLEIDVWAGFPDIAPDGGWLSFLALDRANATYSLYIVRPDGIDLRPLLLDDPNYPLPVWSPDGDYLLYWAGPSGGRALHIVEVETGAETTLDLHALYPNGYGLRSILWSPDSQRIAVVAVGSGPVMPTELVIYDRSGQFLGLRYAGIEAPAWSPDSRYMLGVASPVTRNTVVVFDVDAIAANPADLAAQQPREYLNATTPAWSSTGDLLYIDAFNPTRGTTLSLVNPATGQGRVISQPGDFIISYAVIRGE